MRNPHAEKLDQLLLHFPKSNIVWRFSLIYLLLLALVLALFLSIEYQRFNAETRITLSEQQKRIEFARKLLVGDLYILVSDLMNLAETHELKSFTAMGDAQPQQRERIEQRFLNFIQDRPIYDQVRYLDSMGKEIIRVNHNRGEPQIVSKERLQNKASRYYYRQTISLPRGSLYISPLDLNIEQGVIEMPHKPVIRVATPIYRDDEQLHGVLILTFLAEEMLARFKQWTDNNDQIAFHLLNGNGHWLSHPDSLNEWGFMYGRRNSFKALHPEAWSRISQHANGEWQDATGTLLYQTIDLYREVLSAGNSEAQQENRWIILARLPDRSLLTDIVSKRPLDLGILITILLLMGLGTWRYLHSAAQRGRWTSMTNLMFHGIEQSPAAVVITDKRGNIKYINEKFVQLTGYDSLEVLGENPRLLKSGEKPTEEYKDLWETITSGGIWRGEFHNRRSDGEFYWADARISPIFDDHGEITHFICIQEDVTEKRALQEELEHLATHDTLTGLSNRHVLEQKLNDDINRSIRYSHKLSLFLLDIDHFKRINDNYGHPAGDQVLRVFAELLKRSIRKTDYPARFGGEEFVVVLPETGVHEAEELAERLRLSIAEHPIVLKDGTEISITCSLGIATFPLHGESAQSLIQAADLAMYQAKNTGRNNIRIA